MGTSDPPRVSVIIPCFNQGRFLAQAIDSALRQTYPYVEVIVVDDGSTDQTAEVIGRYGARIIHIWQSNAGLPAARNTGLRASHGAFLLFLDADDWIAPDMIQQQLIVLSDRPDTVGYGTCHYVDLQGLPMGRVLTPLAMNQPFKDLLDRKNKLAPVHCVVLPRSVFERVGEFDVSLTSFEDRDLWIRIAHAGFAFEPIPMSISFYRRYTGSMSSNEARMCLTAIRVSYKAMRLAGCDDECMEILRTRVNRMRGMCRTAILAELQRGQRFAGKLAYFRSVVQMVLRYDPGLIGLILADLTRIVLGRLGASR